MEFSDKIALVTGASRGLGRATAEALGSAGAQVIAVARTVGGLEEADDAIRTLGGPGATLVPLDITDDAGLARLGAAINDRWGRLDLWVHTAVQTPTLAPVEHIDPGEMDRAVAVNLRAAHHLIRVIDPLLRRGEAGRAVFIQDPVAENAFNAAYLAGKQGQALLARSWDAGLARSSRARAILAPAPPMRTALRARCHPGEDRAKLAPPEDVARRLIEGLRAGLPEIDLRAS